MAKSINFENFNNFIKLHDKLLTEKDKTKILNETSLYLSQSGKYANALNAEQLYFTKIENILMTSKNNELIKAVWILSGKKRFLENIAVLYVAGLLLLGFAAEAGVIVALSIFITPLIISMLLAVPTTVAVVGLGLCVSLLVFPIIIHLFNEVKKEKETVLPKLKNALDKGNKAYNQFTLFFKTEVNEKDIVLESNKLVVTN